MKRHDGSISKAYRVARSDADDGTEMAEAERGEMRLVPEKTDDRRQIGAVIPAAGMSSRMQAFKPLLPFRDSTVIECTAEAALEAAPRVVVVLGNHADEVERVLKKRFGDRLTIVRNPDYRSTDMLYSVQIGLDALGKCDGFFLLPGDMPAVGSDTLRALAEAFDGEHKVIFPSCNGRKGHPPLIAASLIPAIRSYRSEGGLRAILSDVPKKVIELGDKGITTDLDTPEDYAAMLNN